MTPGRCRLIAPLAAAVLLVCPPPCAAQPDALDQQVIGWTRHVLNHEPGTFDAAAQWVVTLSWTQLQDILNRVVAQGEEGLLLRSAGLLTDVAVQVPLEQRPRSSDTGKAIIAQDGERRGVGWLDPHLAWSRRLVDRLVRDHRSPRYGEQRAHAIAWYRTVSAWLAWQMNLADLAPHVQRSLALLADDAGVQFDAACYFETYASPPVQASMAAEQSARPSQRRPNDLMREYATSRQNLLALAEKHFARAVELDPSFVEARVRLGRVLTLRDRPRDAVVELQRASESAGDSRVRYFNALFLGRALEQTGDAVNAARAFESAAALFPAAQSPQLALSRLAAERGGDEEARTLIDRVLAAPADEADPWWIYHRASGRDADGLLRSFADRVRSVTVSRPAREYP